MAHILEVLIQQQVRALTELGWSERKIARELGIHRNTVTRYAQPVRDPAAAKCTKTFPDPPLPAAPTAAAPRAPSPGRRRPYAAAVHADAILALLRDGNGPRVIYQVLVERYAYPQSAESVKRYVRWVKTHGALADAAALRPVGVIHHAPGEEAQVDYFQGPSTWCATRQGYRRPWVFRLTLCHSRHSYEEAVWQLDLHTFIRLHEHAFTAIHGAPRVIRHDNTKTGTRRPCRFDPDSHDVYAHFLAHWSAVALPTKPRNPRENGKEERGGGYTKHNAYVHGQHFGGPKDATATRLSDGTYPDGLPLHNTHLRAWNLRWARTRIHGTTKQQVWTHFVEVEQPTLTPPPAATFALFQSGLRTVGLDAHVVVAGAFYPVPAPYIGQQVRVRWDAVMLRVYHQAENGEETQLAVYVVQEPGHWAPLPGQDSAAIVSSAGHIVAQQLRRLAALGPAVTAWAEAAHAARGVRTYRLLQGILELARTHSRCQMQHAATLALEKRLFRYRAFKTLVEAQPERPAAAAARALTTTHAGIRPIEQYTLAKFTHTDPPGGDPAA